MNYVMWWAYIHASDRSIHIKRWFPAPVNNICDCEYARQEKRDGNDNIIEVVGPFAATSDQVGDIAADLFQANGYNIILVNHCYKWDGIYRAIEEPSTSKERFGNLELE